MADVQSNIHVNIDTSEALASIKLLQKQISAFHASMAKSGAAAAAVSANMQQNLINSLNATGKWSASMRTVKTTTESFTNALEKNKLSMREYFRYSAGATRTFGRFFKSEFDTINKVARERVKDLQTQYIKMGRDANGAMKAIAVRPLALDMKNLGTQTAIAAQRQAMLNQLLKQGSTNMLNFGKNTQWAGRQLMVGFTVPLAYLGTAAAKTFMKLEEQAIRFKRVYGELFTTGQETDKMLAEIQLLAKEFTKYGVAVEKTMEMAATAAASGKMGAELLAQVNEGTRLAVLGGVEQEQALETTISLTNAFGLAAEELAGKINFLNAVENQTVVSIEDLTIAIPKAGPVVKQLGRDVEDLAFFLTAMKEGGINASEGANALKSGLASLINPTDKASKMLAGMGVNINGIVEANKGNVKGIVIDFANALNTLDPLNRARAIEQLFGKFQFSRLSTLFQNVIQQGNQASRVLTLTQATTEELAILAERELGRVEESTTYKFKKAIEDLKVTLAPVGEEFLKAITPVAEFVGKMLEKFNNLGDGTKKFVVILTTLLGGIGPIFLMSFGLLANGLANIIKLFVSMKSVFNRTGQSSTILGNQTQFLTVEQAQAAAVASSLDQVHVKLQQTFTSEAAALNALTQAYQRAITAQRGFGGGIIGKGRKGFASGTKKVKPFYFSRGTDTVPAMLTPGEAVIPAGPAQDPANKPAISHMIAGGTMKQFAVGNINVGGTNYPVQARNRSSVTAIQSIVDQSLGTVDDAIKISLRELVNETRVTVAKFKEQMRLTLASQGKVAGPLFAKSDWETRSRSYNASGAGERRTIQDQLRSDPSKGGRGIVAGQAELDQANAAAKAIKAKMTELGATQKQINAAVQLDRAHVIEMSNSKKKLLAAWHSDVWVAQTGAENNLSNSLKNSEKNRRIYLDVLKKSGATQAEITAITDKVTKGIALTGKELEIQGKVLAKINADIASGQIKATSVSKNFRLYSAAVAEAATARTAVTKSQGPKIVAATKRTEAELRRGIERIALAMPKAAEEVLQVASPSKRMQKVGQESGRGLVLGAKEFVDDARLAGTQLGTAIAQGAMSQSQMAAASRAALYGTGPIDPAQKSLRRQLQKQARLDRIAQKRLFTQSSITGMVAGGAAGGAAGGGGNKGRGGFFGRFRRPTPQDPDGDGIPNQRGIGMGGVGMGLSMAAMAGSMAPGKVGEISQKLMMPLMMLTMIGPMLKSPIGVAVVAIGAMAAAIIKLRMDFDKAQDSAIKLRESMIASRDSMRNLAKFSGKVTAGEIMQRRSQERFGLVGAQSGKTTFGESYVQSKEGKAVMDATVESLKTRGVKSTGEDLSNQLMSSVLAGAITADQAKSIALNIGQKTGNYGLGFSVTAQINELIGPNGENLEKEPLDIRMKLIEQTEKQNKQLFNQLGDRGVGRGGFMNLGAVNPKVALGGTTALGAGIGAAIGTAILPGVGTVIGTGLGAIAGATTGYFATRNENKKAGQMSGAVVASQKGAMEQQQEMLDSLDIYYEKKIKELEVEGKIAEAKALQIKYDQDRNTLVDKGAQLSKDIMTSYGSTRGNVRSAMDTGINKLLTQRFKGTDEIQYLDAAKTLLAGSGLTAEQQYLIKVKMSTGELTPSQQVFLFSNFGDDKETIQRYMDIVTNFSARTGENATRVMNMFTNPDGTPNTKMQAEFITKVSDQTDDAAASKYVNFFAEVANTNGVFDMTAVLNYYLQNPEVASSVQDIIDNIDKNKGKLTLDVMTNFLPENVMGAIDKTYFDKLSQDERMTYLKEIATIVNIPDPVIQADPEFLKWQKEGANYNGVSYSGKSIGEQVAAYRQFQPWKVTQESIQQAATLDPGNNKGPSKGPNASPLDDLVKKLRDVRKNQIKVTEGWAASRKVLDSLFGGKKTIDIFGGIEQDLNRLGAKGNFIELIVGMDPKEYENRKRSLFRFDNKDNIIGLKRDAKTIQEALNSIVLGDFVSGMKQQNTQLKDQKKAFNTLVSSGVSVKNAYDMISDATLAAAIASEKNSKSVAKLIKYYKDLQKAKDLAAAKENVKTDIEAEEARQKFLKEFDTRLSSGEFDKFGKRTFIEAAVLFDENLQKLAESGGWGTNFQKRLQQILDSIEFKESMFEKGFGKAMERFSVLEEAIELKFKFDSEDITNAIQEAEDKIASIQYQIDDWEAGLTLIQEQEDKINEKYDEREKALDSLKNLNSEISRQQQGQLTLAGALTQGDIAAAARAAQEMRAQQAENALNNQGKTLEIARENELKSITTEINGLKYTRTEIEEIIKKLQKDIFNIEEETLEPQRESLRLLEIKKREQIKGLVVAGLTKDEWLAVKNNIDQVKTSSTDYDKAIQAALDTVQSIVDYWKQLDGTFTTEHIIKTIYTSEGGSQGGNGNGSDDVVVDNDTKSYTNDDDNTESGTKEFFGSKDDSPSSNSTSSNSNGSGSTGDGPNTVATGNTPVTSAALVTLTNSGILNTDLINAATQAQNEYNKAVAISLKPGTSPSDFGAQLAAADKKLVNISTLAEEKDKYNQMAKSTQGSTPSDFAAGLAAQDAKVITAMNQVASTLVVPKIAKSADEAKADAEKAERARVDAAKAAATAAAIKVATSTPASDKAKAQADKDAKAAANAKIGGTQSGVVANFLNERKPPTKKASGGLIRPLYRPMGGLIPYMNDGGYTKFVPLGSDTVPAMLTPGEFVMSRYAVQNYGVDRMKAINNGEMPDASVYNYSIAVNVRSDANPDEIARAVMSQIRQVDSTRIRGIR